MSGRGQGPPCPTCGKPTALPKTIHDRRYRETHRDQRREYARRYYLEVTKPRQAAIRAIRAARRDHE